MRSRPLGVLLLASLIVAGSACVRDHADTSSDQHSLRASEFTSDQYAYSLELPEDWSALPATRALADGEPPYTAAEPPGTDVLSPSPNRAVRQMTLPALVIGAQPVRPGTSLEEWSEEVERIVARQKGCEAPAQRGSTVIDGRAAVTLVYPACPEGSGLFHLWTAVVGGGFGFHIVWFDGIGNEIDDQAALEQMLGTVEWSGPRSKDEPRATDD